MMSNCGLKQRCIVFFYWMFNNFLNKLISMRRFTWIWNWTGFDGALFSLGRKAIKPSDLPPIEPGRANNRGGKCQVLWILCCTVHMYNCICIGRPGERVFKLLKKCVEASITCQVPCRQPRIVSKDWNLCAEETQHMQNPSVLWRHYDARSKFSQVPFYDQVDIMGYPTEPYYPYPYYLTDALLSLFLLSYWCIVLQWYDINA